MEDMHEYLLSIDQEFDYLFAKCLFLTELNDLKILVFETLMTKKLNFLQTIVLYKVTSGKSN